VFVSARVRSGRGHARALEIVILVRAVVNGWRAGDPPSSACGQAGWRRLFLPTKSKADSSDHRRPGGQRAEEGSLEDSAG